MYDQLMYTQQAESVQAEIDSLQKQYDSALQEQRLTLQKQYEQQSTLQKQHISALQEQQSILQEQINSAKSIADSFDRVVDTLDDARRSIWNSDANISTSRLAEARADLHGLRQGNGR